jgi:glutathione S-transferase
MKVYGHPMSTCTRKVLTVLAEKGTEAEFVLVDLMKGEQKQPDNVARQPFGVVPAIDDDGFKLYESRAIVRYLDEKLGGTSLTPGDAKGRALMNQWISVEQSYLAGPAVKILFQRVFNPMSGKEPDETIVSSSKLEVAKVLDVAEKTLSGQEYLAGKSFSLADVCFLPYVAYLFTSKVGDLVTERPNVNAWWKRTSSRPSWVKVAGQ